MSKLAKSIVNAENEGIEKAHSAPHVFVYFYYIAMKRVFIKNEPKFNRFALLKNPQNRGFLTDSTKFSTKIEIQTPKNTYFSTLSTGKPVETETFVIRLQLSDNNTNCNYFVHNYVHKIVHTRPENVHTFTERIKNERNKQACNGNKARRRIF